MVGDLKQIPATNMIGPSSAGLTRKGGSCQNEAGSKARRLLVGKGALLTASPLRANPLLPL